MKTDRMARAVIVAEAEADEDFDPADADALALANTGWLGGTGTFETRKLAIALSQIEVEE